MLPDSPNQLSLDLPDQLERPRVDSSAAAVFRPIHYLGSKLRLAPSIADALDGVDATRGPVLDLFAGSGTTALALASRRQVIASDIQEYSRVICSAVLTRRQPSPDLAQAFNSKQRAGTETTQALRHALEPLVAFEHQALDAAASGNPEPVCAVLEHGSILAAELGISVCPDEKLRHCLAETLRRLKQSGLAGSPVATVVRYFGGAYFAYAQALELDCLTSVAAETGTAESTDLFTAALMSTASDAVNTVGKQFAQPIRPRAKNGAVKRHLLAKIDRDRRLNVQSVFSGWLDKYLAHQVPGNGHIAVRADYRDVLRQFAGQYSVVYADPPYTRDHYSRFYHVLETMALRDNPSIAQNPGASDGKLSRGVYRDDRHQSPFCIRSQAPAAFEELFELASTAGANLVMSYSPFETGAHPRMMQIDTLRQIAQTYYLEVDLQTVEGVTHSKLNHTRLNFESPEQAEVLLMCKRAK